MQYLPSYENSKYLWCHPVPCEWCGVKKHWLPPDLFDRLIAGVYSPEDSHYLAAREYDTEAAAYADLQQAAQALCASQHQPTQYRNPF